jgi:thioredoxin-dependent peroxiredoxin
MSRITTFKGNTLNLIGNELKVGSYLPEFTVVNRDMAPLASSVLKGKTGVILTVPSLDTPVCSIETTKFNQEVSKLSSNICLLVLSRDLPFAQKRWCGAEGVEQLLTGSDYKSGEAGKALGAYIQEWDLLSRAVFVTDATGKLTYVEYVNEISEEPNYQKALEAVKSS